MNSDFLDAHCRHWNDAEYLYDDSRWANADQLYGMAAECGLKRLMLAFGMPFDPGRNMPQKQQDRQHADGIWNRYQSYRCGHPRGAHYPLTAANPFSDWSASQRYAHSSQFDSARVDRHKVGAEAVRLLIQKARRDGLI